jgi:hypothetical protein
MALTYDTGTISQPDAGSVGQAMVEKIRDNLVAHAAWELVEEFTPSGGAARWYVFKCLATESGLASDFFVVIGRTLSSGKLEFFICEGYNSGSHTASFFSRNSGTLTYDSLGRDTSTFTLGTTALGSSSGTVPMANITWTPGGTSTKWWTIIDDDRFAVAFNGASNGFIAAGVYIPLTQLPIDMPLMMIGQNSSTGQITRNPAAADQVISSNGLWCTAGGGSSVGNGPALGFQGDLRYNDKLQDNQRPVAEQGMVVGNTGGDQPATGWALGKQKGMRVTNGSLPVGFAFGDAYALEGNLWVPFAPNDGRMWDTGVAAA